MDLQLMVEDYLDAVAFTDEDQWEIDHDKGFAGFHPTCWEEAEADCQAFMDALDAADVEYEDLPVGMFATDFWLTRNRHGAGFWDRGLGDRGDELTLAAQAMGGRDTYVGDDGWVYFD